MLKLVILNVLLTFKVAEAAESISAMVTFFKSLSYISKTGIQSSLSYVESGIKVDIGLVL